MLYFRNQLSLNPIKKNSGIISNTCISIQLFGTNNEYPDRAFNIFRFSYRRREWCVKSGLSETAT